MSGHPLNLQTHWALGRLVAAPVLGLSWVACGHAWAADFEVRVVISPRAAASCTASSAPGAAPATALSVVCGTASSIFAVPSSLSLSAVGVPLNPLTASGSAVAPLDVQARRVAAAAPLGAQASSVPTAQNTPMASTTRSAVPVRGGLEAASLAPASVSVGGPGRAIAADSSAVEPAGLVSEGPPNPAVLASAAIELTLSF